MSITQNDPNAFLMGGGSKSAKFESVGDIVGGPILDLKVTQQTEFGTGAPKAWSNGDPMMQLVVTVQTDARDDDRDDGQRALYLRGGAKRHDTTQGAVAEACRKVGVSGLTIGGILRLAYIGDEPSGSGNPRKLYSAQYEPPVVSAADPFGATEAPSPAADPFA